MIPAGPNQEMVEMTTPVTNLAGYRVSIKLVIVALVLTGAVLAWLSWSTYDLNTEATSIRAEIWRSQDHSGSIIHLDEVLTMSARMAAATGDPQWETRFRKFEPQLKKAMTEILALAPSQSLSDTDAANTKLVEMETRAFAFVRENHAEEARAILFSQEYEFQKGIYALGMSKFFRHLQMQLDATQQSRHRKTLFSAGASIIVLAILLFLWLTIIRRMHKSHNALLISIVRRRKAEARPAERSTCAGRTGSGANFRADDRECLAQGADERTRTGRGGA